jgi:hypothetical protein
MNGISKIRMSVSKILQTTNNVAVMGSIIRKSACGDRCLGLCIDRSSSRTTAVHTCTLKEVLGIAVL